MKKLLACIGLVMAVAAASGCTFYFGPEDDDDRYYSYCDDTGCYTCDSATGECWSDGGGGGYGCYSDDDCAAGCYCDSYSGECIETGFCSYDEECGDGYVCDDRASCVPDGTDPTYCWDTGCSLGSYCDSWTGQCVPSVTCDGNDDCDTGYFCNGGTCTPSYCTDDSECAAGCYCEPASGCVETGFCSNDAECPADGDTCDETRSTCIPGEDPAVTCVELSTDETGCVDRDDCLAIYGTECYDPGGNSCEEGTTNCTCGPFTFIRCQDL